MSKEWLAQLSATAAKQAPQPMRYQAQPRSQPPAPSVVRKPDGSQRSFFGAIIGSIIRWAILSAIAGAVFVFILSEQEYLEDSMGERVLYGLWYLATVLPQAISNDVASAIDANAIYEALKPHAGLLPFVAPLAFGVLVTALFLPTVNAYRRRFGLRFFVLLFNLVLLYWALESGWIKLNLTGTEGWLGAQSVNAKAVIAWAILLVFSAAGFRLNRSSMMTPTPAPSRPGMVSGATRPSPARRPTSSMPARSAQVIAGRTSGPAIQRTISGGSWRRPR